LVGRTLVVVLCKSNYGAAIGNVGLGIALGAALGSTMQKEDSSSEEG